MHDTWQIATFVILYIVSGIGMVKAIRALDNSFVGEVVFAIFMIFFWPVVPVIWAFISFKKD